MPIPPLNARAALPLAALVALAACSSAPQPKFQQELFDTGATPFARNFNASSTDACEAARRALLNQGYMTTIARPDAIDATKDFQPNGDSHITIEFHVVCTPGDDASNTSVVYANAVQDGYALKKSDTSASVGLSLLGSVSLPIRSNSDAMVKISSETIQAGKFYDRFFEFVGRYLQAAVKTAPVPAVGISSETLPPSPQPVPPAPPAPAASSVPPVSPPAPAQTADAKATGAAQPASAPAAP